MSFTCPTCGVSLPEDPGVCPACRSDTSRGHRVSATDRTPAQPVAPPTLGGGGADATSGPWIGGTPPSGPTPPSTAGTARASLPMSLGVGTLINDRYRLDKVIGRGGFGRVYLAHDERLDLEVAIKLIPGEWAAQPEIFSALEREAKLAIRLSHTNIVRFYNLEAAGEDRFIVMEYVTGENLNQYRKRLGRVPEEEVRHIAIQCCDALAYAHSRKVVHRDIKPANIILSPQRDGSFEVKMVDFGIARELQDNLSRVTRQTSSGTPVYMSPEQLRGTYDHRTDLYSLGVTMYEALNGQPPFRKGGLESLMWQIMNEMPPPIPGVSDGMNDVIRKALAKDTADRWQDANQLKRALNRSVSGPVRRVAERVGTTLIAPSKEKGQGVGWFVLAALSAFVLTFGTLVAVWYPDLVRSKLADAREWVGALELPSTLGGERAGPDEPEPGPEPVELASTDDVPASVEPPPEDAPAAPATRPEEAGVEEKVAALLEGVADDRRAQRLTRPAGNNASEKLSAILALDPDNAEALSIRRSLGQAFVAAGQRAWIKDADYGKARLKYVSARKFLPEDPSISRRLAEIERDRPQAERFQEILEDMKAGRRQLAAVRLRTFLDSYPDGVFAQPARDVLEALGGSGGRRRSVAPARDGSNARPSASVAEALRRAFDDARARAERASSFGESIAIWETYLKRWGRYDDPLVLEARVQMNELKLKSENFGGSR